MNPTDAHPANMNLPSADGRVTYDEFLSAADEDVSAEWVNGEVFFERYQIKTGADLPGREPDLMFLSNEHADRNRHTHIEGPADLVIEVVSLESRERDHGVKFYEYEKGGVPEYWLIDPLRNRPEFYQLDEAGAYDIVQVAGGGFYSCAQLPGLRIRPEWLWQEPLPSIPSIMGDAGACSR